MLSLFYLICVFIYPIYNLILTKIIFFDPCYIPLLLMDTNHFDVKKEHLH